jgi:hypothetical protein
MGRRGPAENKTASGGTQHDPPPGTHERTREATIADSPRCATVTIQRTADYNVINQGVIDLTVVFKYYPVSIDGEWILVSAIDEDGVPVHLTEVERDLAHCFVDAGVDDTGR